MSTREVYYRTYSLLRGFSSGRFTGVRISRLGAFFGSRALVVVLGASGGTAAAARVMAMRGCIVWVL